VSVDAFAATGSNLATQHLPVTGNTITMELDNPVNISGTTYAWTLKVTGTKTCASGTNDCFIGNKITTRRFYVTISVDGANHVTSCSGNGTDTFWTANGTSIDYMGGNVGIGTATPAAKLSIAAQGYSDPVDYGQGLQVTTSTGGQTATFIKQGIWPESLGFYPGVNVFGFGTAANPDAGFQPTHMAIEPTGHVSFGYTSAWVAGFVEKVNVKGNIYVEGTVGTCTIGNAAGAVSCASDERLKEHVVPIEHALEKIGRLEGVEFDWNEKAQAPGTHAIGVIAQTLQKVFPWAVGKLPGGYLSVDYGSLTAPLIQAVKELYALVTEHFKTTTEQGREIASLTARADRAERENASMKAYLCGKDPAAPFCSREEVSSGKAH
jgi:hypothetical protein